jgi:endonuclease/exonuclease/phosphatase (EEP) superfamily protein YafD
MLRALTRFFIAVLIGVGATLGWQSYGDAARNMAIAQAPTLAWLLSISATKSAAMAATSPDPAQQLEPLAFNLDAVRRSVEQLAAKQDQMAQNIAALQAVEEDIRQKMSSAPPSLFQQTAPIPPPKPPQPRAQSPAAQSSSAPRPAPPAGPVLLSR